MKISKIPGLGDYGVYIDDADLENISDEEWLELGKLHLKTLVTIFRNTNLSLERFEHLILQFGTSNNLSFYRLLKEYNLDLDYGTWSKLSKGEIQLSARDRTYVDEATNIKQQRNIQRVTGKRDDQGKATGLFAEGELLWHSNESGQLAFTPGVGLLSVENVVGSSTGFLTTANWYQSQSESFRSELNEMIIGHDFTPGKMNPGLNESQDTMLSRNFSPEPCDIPLVINSPGGITGLHFSPNTISYIKGMSKEESKKLFALIENDMFKEPHIYDHWYQAQSGDLLLFDNSITLHRRLGDVKNRLLYRTTMDYSTLLPYQWQPYFHDEFAEKFKECLTDIRLTLKRPAITKPYGQFLINKDK